MTVTLNDFVVEMNRALPEFLVLLKPGVELPIYTLIHDVATRTGVSESVAGSTYWVLVRDGMVVEGTGSVRLAEQNKK